MGGIGGVVEEAQIVGNVVQLVQAFHQLNPVPPLGCTVMLFIKEEAGKFWLAGTEF